jgi:uncharacterized SAM-binding protein YcdF (DUF218 family)
MKPPGLLGRLLIALLMLAVLLVVLHRPLLRLAASALVVEGALQQADAIVVLAGGTPSREAMAARLYREGWAPRVVISRPMQTSSIRELIALGVRPLDRQGESRAALQKYGVPSDRIVALTVAARITEAELHLVQQAALADGYHRVILVTSPPHTRRVKLIWSRQSRTSHIEGIVRAAGSEDFTTEEWWRKRRSAELLLHEYLGILAILLGVSSLMR